MFLSNFWSSRFSFRALKQFETTKWALWSSTCWITLPSTTFIVCSCFSYIVSSSWESLMKVCFTSVKPRLRHLSRAFLSWYWEPLRSIFLHALMSLRWILMSWLSSLMAAIPWAKKIFLKLSVSRFKVSFLFYTKLCQPSKMYRLLSTWSINCFFVTIFEIILLFLSLWWACCFCA